MTEAAGDTRSSRQSEGERIAKRIARSGLCSRREAERRILEGRVMVDGAPVLTLGLRVRPGQRIEVDGEPLPEVEPPRLFRFHKPQGVLVSAHDPKGRRTIYDLLPPTLPRLMPVGRLDFNSEGLLLLTNDGELKRHLELPTTGWVRRYRVRALGRLKPEHCAQLARGMRLEGVRYGPVQVELEQATGANAWYRVALREGKNREIRRLFAHFGLQVNRIIRTSYGPFQLGSLPRGALREVPARVLRDQLGRYLDRLAAVATGEGH